MTEKSLSTADKRIVRYGDHEESSLLSNVELLFESIKGVDGLLLKIDKVEGVKDGEVEISELEPCGEFGVDSIDIESIFVEVFIVI